MSDSALSRVMGQAEQAARDFTPSDANLPAVQQGGRALTPSSGGSRPSLDSMMDSSGISVDGYLVLKYEGFRYGELKGLFDNVVASIDMTQVVPIYQARGNKSGTTTFIKSYDGETTPDGQSFALALKHLKDNSDVVTGPYQTSEIPLTVLEDVQVGKDTIPAGTKIGTTPPITGVKFFSAFLKTLRERGLMTSTVKVNVKHLPQTNSKRNEWGVADFELLGVVEDEE